MNEADRKYLIALAKESATAANISSLKGEPMVYVGKTGEIIFGLWTGKLSKIVGKNRLYDNQYGIDYGVDYFVTVADWEEKMKMKLSSIMQPDIEEVLKQYNLAKKFLNKKIKGEDDMKVRSIYVVFDRPFPNILFNKQYFAVILELDDSREIIYDPENPPTIEHGLIAVKSASSQSIIRGRYDKFWVFESNCTHVEISANTIVTTYNFMKAVYADSKEPCPEIQSVIILGLIFPYSVVECMYRIQNMPQ